MHLWSGVQARSLSINALTTKEYVMAEQKHSLRKSVAKPTEQRVRWSRCKTGWKLKQGERTVAYIYQLRPDTIGYYPSGIKYELYLSLDDGESEFIGYGGGAASAKADVLSELSCNLSARRQPSL